jgi:hypothetical protein
MLDLLLQRTKVQHHCGFTGPGNCEFFAGCLSGTLVFLVRRTLHDGFFAGDDVQVEKGIESKWQ